MQKRDRSKRVVFKQKRWSQKQLRSPINPKGSPSAQPSRTVPPSPKAVESRSARPVHPRRSRAEPTRPPACHAKPGAQPSKGSKSVTPIDSPPPPERRTSVVWSEELKPSARSGHPPQTTNPSTPPAKALRSFGARCEELEPPRASRCRVSQGAQGEVAALPRRRATQGDAVHRRSNGRETHTAR